MEPYADMASMRFPLRRVGPSLFSAKTSERAQDRKKDEGRKVYELLCHVSRKFKGASASLGPALSTSCEYR